MWRYRRAHNTADDRRQDTSRWVSFSLMNHTSSSSTSLSVPRFLDTFQACYGASFPSCARKALSPRTSLFPVTSRTWSYVTGDCVGETRRVGAAASVCRLWSLLSPFVHSCPLPDFLTIPWKSRGGALLYYTGDDIVSDRIRSGVLILTSYESTFPHLIRSCLGLAR